MSKINTKKRRQPCNTLASHFSSWVAPSLVDEYRKWQEKEMIRTELPSGCLRPPLFIWISLRSEGRGVAGEGGHRWPFGLSVRCPPRADWAEQRERRRVKGKGVWVRGAMHSFPLQSARWLQAVDFHALFTSSHLSLKCVRKLHPWVGTGAAWASVDERERGRETGSLLGSFSLIFRGPPKFSPAFSFGRNKGRANTMWAQLHMNFGFRFPWETATLSSPLVVVPVSRCLAHTCCSATVCKCKYRWPIIHAITLFQK